MQIRKEKDRPSVGADRPVEPQITSAEKNMGYLDTSLQDRLNQDAVMFRAGYDYAYDFLMPRIVGLEDLLRWYIKQSVTNIFDHVGFDGAEAARQRSTVRFWADYGERDAA